MVRTDPCGVVTIDRERLRRMPEEIALRLVGRCIMAAGGSPGPVPLGRLEPIVDGLRRSGDRQSRTWTLARAMVRAGLDTIQIEREPGRLPLPRIVLAAGVTSLWDGRFVASVAAGTKATYEVRALGADGLRHLRKLGQPIKTIRPLRLAPSFWQDGALLAVPAVDFWGREELKGRLSAEFLGLRYNSAGPGSDQNEDSEGF
jgi:hypothetical protein